MFMILIIFLGITQWESPHPDNAPEFVSSTTDLEPDGKASDLQLPPGWEMFVDDESGDIYFHNEETGL